MDLSSIEAKIWEINEKLVDVKLELQTYFNDDTIPLSNRWKTYVNFMSKHTLFNELDNYGPDLRTLNQFLIDCPYDYFSIEKYETVSYLQIIDTLNENVGNTGRIWKDINLTEEKVDLVKEEILKDFPITGFIYNW